MKNLIGFIFAAASLSLHAQGTARIFFIRNTGPSLSNFKVFIDDAFVCKLSQGRYSVHEVRPGKHTFMAQFAGTVAKEGAKKEAVTVECEAGKTYYLSLVIRQEFWSKNLFCEEITESSWKRLYADLRVEDNCKIE